MSDFFAEGQCNRAEQRPRKNEGYLPCTHSLFIKTLIDLLKCGLKSVLKIDFHHPNYLLETCSNHSQKLEMGGGRRGSDNDDSMIHQTSPRKTSLTQGLPPPAPSRNSLRSPACCPLHHLHHHHIAQLFGSLMKQSNFRGHEIFSLTLFCHAFIATPSSQGSSFSDLVRLAAKSRAQMSPPLFAPNISLSVSQLFFHFFSNVDLQFPRHKSATWPPPSQDNFWNYWVSTGMFMFISKGNLYSFAFTLIRLICLFVNTRYEYRYMYAKLMSIFWSGQDIRS